MRFERFFVKINNEFFWSLIIIGSLLKLYTDILTNKKEENCMNFGAILGQPVNLFFFGWEMLNLSVIPAMSKVR
jgi:hypothetical protein